MTCTPLLAVTLLALISSALAGIYLENCATPADQPEVQRGNFFNLCVDDEEIADQAQSWIFTDAEIKNSKFVNCVFKNVEGAKNNFTRASWVNVDFDGCFFGSTNIYEPNIVFDNMQMTNVRFLNTEFDHSVRLVFSSFTMNNVTFQNCSFKGDTLFENGQINMGYITDSNIMHSVATQTTSSNASLTFRQMTVRDLTMLGSTAVSPLRFEGVNGADLSFNKSSINKFFCHSQPNERGTIEYLTQFNDTAFQQVDFNDEVKCDMTSWRGFFMGNVTFLDNARFDSSKIVDLYWDKVKMYSTKGECLELNFSRSEITRKVLANVTVECSANFEASIIETVYVKNFNATRPNFQGAMFVEQEYIDGACCSLACANLNCMCNISQPSGLCPAAPQPVNVSAPHSVICFPGDASVLKHDGSVVPMSELNTKDRIAVGNGLHSDVYLFTHRIEDQSAEYIALTHAASSRPTRLSPKHYIYCNGKLQTAASVRIGDRLRGADGEDNVLVTGVSREVGRGVYAPTTLHGDLIVDGVVASSYTSAIHPKVAHRLLAPLRLLYQSGFSFAVSRLTIFERRSFEPVARRLGLAVGPKRVDV